MIERKPIAFSDWTPVQRDNRISYTYARLLHYRNGTVGARKIAPGSDRWMRAKYRIAASALGTGAEEFTVYGGLGSRRWKRTVTCTEQEAIDFFEQAIKGGAFMLKGTYRKALLGRERRRLVNEQ